jgi:hypothetical protein
LARGRAHTTCVTSNAHKQQASHSTVVLARPTISLIDVANRSCFLFFPTTPCSALVWPSPICHINPRYYSIQSVPAWYCSIICAMVISRLRKRTAEVFFHSSLGGHSLWARERPNTYNRGYQNIIGLWRIRREHPGFYFPQTKHSNRLTKVFRRSSVAFSSAEPLSFPILPVPPSPPALSCVRFQNNLH